MKEAFGETMYAENYGVDQTTVSVEQAPVETDSPVFELMSYCMNNNLSIQENYEYFASQMDVDSLIDWMIFEGYSANTDVKQNLRYFKSTATGDKWQHALYDLDWAWYFEIGFAEMLSPSKPRQYANISNAALRNPEFREKFFTRVAELKNGVLSDEHVLERIDEFAELLSPEIAREKARWGGSYQTWERNVQNMRSYLTQRDHWASLIQHLRRFAGLTDEEYQKYFAE